VRAKVSLLAVALAGMLAFLALTGRVQAQSPACTTTPTGTQYSSADVIAVPNDHAESTSPVPAGIYPSVITVPNTVTGTVTGIQIQLNNIAALGQDQNPNYYAYDALNDTEMLLVSPTGQSLEFFGSPGPDAAHSVTDLTILFGSYVSSTDFPYMPNNVDPPGSGTACWAPGDYYVTSGFPTTGSDPPVLANIQLAQTQGGATLASVFNGATAAGDWRLYLIEDYGSPVTINGWDLYLTVNGNTPGTTTTVSSNDNNVAVTGGAITFTATVTSTGGSPTGTVAFSANGNTISGCAAQPVSNGEATCNTALTTQGLNPITASYTPSGNFGSSSGGLTEVVEAAATNPSGTTWCNTGAIVTPDAPIAGPLYPSIIKIPSTAYPGETVSTLTVELNGETAATQNDGMNDQFLLVAPGGGKYNLDLLDEAFAGNGVSDVSITVSDSGNIPYDLTPANGNTFVPYDGNINAPTLTGPASTAATIDTAIPGVPATLNRPQGLSGDVYTHYTLESAFNGAPATGDWALYVYGYSPNTLNNGWCVDLTLNSGTATTTAVTSNQQKSTTGHSVGITATVTSGGNSPVSSGTVTMVDTTTGTTLLNAASLNSSGQVTYTTSNFTEGDHQITATYNPASGYDGSFGSIVQRVDDATVVSGTGNTWQYCNTGPVEIPAATRGAYTPNPSNVFVTNFPGTLDTVSLTLNNFSIGPTATWETASLIEGSNGAGLDFFSNVGGPGNEVVTAGNYVFEDSASGLVPYTPANQSTYPNVVPGNYKPTSEPPFETSADTFISSVSGFYNVPASFSLAAPTASGTFSSVFPSGTNPNGTWSLFFNQYGEDAEAGAANGWCMQLVNNPIDVAATVPDTGSFTQGQQGASFTVDIANSGPGSTGDPTGGSNPMTVTDTLNSAFTYGNYSGTGWSCSASGQTVTCKNDSAIAESSGYPELTIDVNVSGTATGTISNSVTVSGAGATATPSNTDKISVVPAPSLSLTKSHTVTFTQGQTAVWNIAVANASGSSATSGTITLNDTLPTGYTLASSSGTGWSCGGVSNAVTCTSTTSIAGGNSSTVSLTVNVAANSPTSVTNSASAYGGGDLVHSSASPAMSNTDNVTVMAVLSFAPNPPNATFGSVYFYPLSASNGTAPYTFQATNLPPGLSLTPDTLNIIGNCTASSTTVELSVKDSAGATASAGPLTIVCNPVPQITTMSLPAVYVNQPYSTQISATGGTPPLSFLLFNPAPNGFSIGNSNGVLSGTAPSTPQTLTFNVLLFDSWEASSGQTLTVAVYGTPSYVVTTKSDDATGLATNCTDQNLGGATPDANCSLRDALAAAAAVGEGNITFSPTVFTTATTINLTGILNVPANTSVQGLTSGSGYTLTNRITLDGNGNGGVFNLNTGATGAAIANLTILNGSATGISAAGINVASGASLTVSQSTITSDTGAPGLISVGITNAGTMALSYSTVSGYVNETFATIGAGISNTGTLTIDSSTIYGNQSLGFSNSGGGIYSSGTLTINSSTITGNLVNGVAGYGGGIYSTGSLTLNNSIVSGNTDTSVNEGGTDLYGAYTGSGDLIGNASNGSTATSSATNLSALGNYGGPTQTIIPLPGSNAICGALEADIPNGVTTDQRGFANTNATYAGYSAGTPCVDTGAVQTDYSLSFSTEPQPIPPAATIVPSTNFEAGVTLDESSAPFTAAAETIPLTLSKRTGNLTGNSATTSSGIATYSTLQLSTTGTGDELTASLALNSAAVPAPSASVISNPFTVTPLLVATSVVVTGYPSPVYAGVPHTGTVTVDDQFGNPLTTYSGSATITTSDNAASVPSSPVTITSGTGTFTVTFNTTGTNQSITAAINGLTSMPQAGIQVNPVPGFVVTTATDDATGVATNCPGSDCSLRDALAAAAADGEGNVTFSPTVFTVPTTINLTGDLNVPANTSIQGRTSGGGYTLANLITLSGACLNTVGTGASIANLVIVNGGGSAIEVNYGASLAASEVTVTGGGHTYSIFQQGTMTLTASTVAGNTEGAGISNTGTLTVNYSTIYNNQIAAQTSGAAAGIYSDGTLTVNSSTITGNGGNLNWVNVAGGISSQGSLTINNSIVSGNTANSSENDVVGTFIGSGYIIGNATNLSAPGNYGGPTQTILPAPGSNAICGALKVNIPNGVTADQRGLPNTNATYTGYTSGPACVDAGAVQTDYSLSFSTEPEPISPATSIIENADFEAAVTLDESGAPLIGSAVAIPLTLSAGTGTLTGNSANTSTTTGIATYNTLAVSATGAADALKANLALNSAAVPAPSISVTSTPPFAVEPPTENVTVGTNYPGIAFSVDGVTYTSSQMFTWNIGDQHTLDMPNTTPTVSGTEYGFAQWFGGGQGVAQTPYTATVTANVPSYTAQFAIEAYQLNVSVGANGTLAAATTAESGNFYTPQNQATISAIPNVGYYFVNWTGENSTTDIAISTNATTTVTMNGPESLTANFAPIPGYVVSTTADDATGVVTNCPVAPSVGTACSLRDAIAAADANSGGAGIITFSPTVFATSNTPIQNTIKLLSALPVLNGQITIQGLGANVITVSGNNSASVGSIFQVPNTATVSISGIAIANGNATSVINGGGINSAGTLTVANCVFSGNTAVAAGAIYVAGGTLTVQNSTFSSNSATNAGGAAIYAAGASANISYSTFYNNISGGNGYGGAIVAYTPLTVSDSTFSSNSSSVSGGAIYASSSATVVNSIFSGNSAGSDAGVTGSGVNASYNLFYNNLDIGTNKEDDCNGCITTSTITGINPNLAPLGYYGEPTLTMLPLPASPAICAASGSLIPAGSTTDQRGDPDFATYNSTKCYDLGAVQTNYALSFNALNEPPATGTVTNAAMSPAPVVTVTESMQPFIAAAASLSVTDLKSALSPTPVPASTSTTNGQATLSNLIFTTTTSSDTLTATLALNPNNTALNLTTTSTQFGVTPQAVSVTCSATTAGTVNVALSAAETVSGGSLPYTFSVTGSLPSGLFFNTLTGAVTGTPLAPGTFSIAVQDKIGTAGASCPFTIAPQTTQTIQLSGLPSVATYGSAGPYTLSVSGGASTNPVALSVTGPATLNGLVLTITGAGNVTVTANQAGSGIYAPASPVSLTVIVSQLSQTITFTGLPAQIAYGYGGPYTLTATGGGSNNPVTFSVTGPAKLSGSTLTITGVGTVVVTANQSGTTNYAAAAPVSQTISVVSQLAPIVSWATPAPISASTALSGVQLDAVANIPGTFSYLPCAGTLLSPGPQVVVATFTPNNNLLAEYSIVKVQVTIQVDPSGSTLIGPYIQVNNGPWQNISSITVNPTDTVNLGPQPVSGGSWSWTGPNGFTSSSRVINGISLPSPINIYTATYKNKAGATSVQAFTITVNSTSIAPMIEVDNGPWQPVSSVTANYTDTVNLGPQPVSGGTWSWTGPNGFTSTARQINGIPLPLPINIYTATYTNPDGVTSTQAFTITVAPTTITPVLQVNGAAWQNVAAVTVADGSTVILGPQPVSGGSWSWTGPSGFTSTARQVNATSLTSPANVYIATYTNPAGVTSVQAFTITIAPTAITPYLEANNNGVWQTASSVTVSYGGSVSLGPQVGISGGSWSWSGPGVSGSTSREIDNVSLPSGTNTFIATYTNPAGVQSTETFTITIAPTTINPYTEVNNGVWQTTNTATVSPGSAVNLGPQVGISGGTWNWSGPGVSGSTSREIDNVSLPSGTNTFIATYTNPAGVQSTETFTIAIAPTAITPYLEANNNGVWQTTNSITVNYGSAVSLGPQVGISGGTWSWSGPGVSGSTSREIDNVSLPSGTNTFIATYTNPAGVTSTETFTITVNPTMINPYTEVNNGPWQTTNTATVSPGSAVSLGPQVGISGGSWSWSGPGVSGSTSREIDNVSLPSGTNTFIATYTNPAGVTSTETFTITVNPTTINPYTEVNNGPWQVTNSATVNYGSAVNLGPQVGISGGSWSWSGPGVSGSTSREIDNVSLPSGTNTFIATYTNPAGVTSAETFTIMVNPTTITPYTEVNNGPWQVTNSVTVSLGSTVSLGPQPVSGGMWSWSGPNGFNPTSREIDNIPLSLGTNTYVATYTNASGVQSVETFTVLVIPQSAISVSSIQTLSSWIAATDSESGGGGGAMGTMKLVSSPSYGGSEALQFVTNFTDFGDERYSTVFGDDTSATNFIWDGWVYLDQSVSDIANLEMDMNQVLANGQTVIYGFQCDGYSGTWDYTINAGTPQSPVDEWVHSSAPCNVRNWSTETWHHVQVQYSRDNSGNVTYSSVWLDGVQSQINATVPSAFALGWGQVLLTNFEVDGLGASGSSTMYLGDLTVYRW
jgi:CSLREA domain-containing protein